MPQYLEQEWCLNPGVKIVKKTKSLFPYILAIRKDRKQIHGKLMIRVLEENKME